MGYIFLFCSMHIAQLQYNFVCYKLRYEFVKFYWKKAVSFPLKFLDFISLHQIEFIVKDHQARRAHRSESHSFSYLHGTCLWFVLSVLHI